MRLEMSKADKKRLGYACKIEYKEADRDSDSWFTPNKYLEAARKTLGGQFCLDPFSSKVANKTVDANAIYTIDDDALSRAWKVPTIARRKTVWMNPPYGKAMSLACAKFVEEYRKGTFKEGVVLTNNATETLWFQKLAGDCTAICFTDHRIKFEAFDGKEVSGNTRGQAFFYFGANVHKFHEHFKQFGFIYSKYDLAN